MSSTTTREEVEEQSQVVNEEPATPTSAATLRLRLCKNTGTKTNRRVSWTQDTVDNEFMNKKKSKCCCQYRKPKMWDESSDEDDNADHDCEHCKGHKKSDYNHKRDKENTHRHRSVDETSSHCHDHDHDHDNASSSNADH